MDQRPDYQTFRFPSATQTGTIEGRVYLPLQTDETIDCIQIIHGMAEHSGRYARLSQQARSVRVRNVLFFLQGHPNGVF